MKDFTKYDTEIIRRMIYCWEYYCSLSDQEQWNLIMEFEKRLETEQENLYY